MTLTMNLFGEELYQGTAKDQVARLLEKYPACKENRAMFYWLAAVDRCKWIAQLPPERQIELREMFYSVESLRRRLQDYKAKDRSMSKNGV